MLLLRMDPLIISFEHHFSVPNNTKEANVSIAIPWPFWSKGWNISGPVCRHDILLSSQD